MLLTMGSMLVMPSSPTNDVSFPSAFTIYGENRDQDGWQWVGVRSLDLIAAFHHILSHEGRKVFASNFRFLLPDQKTSFSC